jgi:hypothetical protein
MNDGTFPVSEIPFLLSNDHCFQQRPLSKQVFKNKGPFQDNYASTTSSRATVVNFGRFLANACRFSVAGLPDCRFCESLQEFKF